MVVRPKCEACGHALDAIEKFVREYNAAAEGRENHLTANLMAVAIEEELNHPDVGGDPRKLLARFVGLLQKAMRDRAALMNIPTTNVA